MKLYHILPTAVLGMGLALNLASCADDNDSNPVLHMPSTFTLNTPALAGQTYDLKNTSDSITFTWSQPDYGGMPLVTTYKLQYLISKDGSEVTTDADGHLKFTDESQVKEYDESKTTCEYKLAPADVDLALLRELGVTADNVPASVNVYYRLSAKTTSTPKVYSNIVKMTYAPYFQRLEIAEPVTWYLVGSCFADGSWGDQVPTTTLPLYLSAESYNEDTGYGTVSWTGYIPDGAIFKMRGSLTDSWASQIGQGAKFGEYVLNDGGSGNITPDKGAGIYTITLDTKAVAMGDANGISITKTDDAPTYSQVYLNGSFNEWGEGVALTPVNTTVGENNHDWYTHIHLPAASEVKFQANNWGMEIGSKYSETPSSKSGYYGVGAKSGGWNIYITNESDYLVIVNDITGAFRFIKE